MKAEKKPKSTTAKKTKATKSSKPSAASIRLQNRRRIEELHEEKLLREESCELYELY